MRVRRCKESRGFTAFEALIAATILAILTTAVSTALMAGRAQSRLARDTVNASMLGRALLDEVMRLPAADPGGYTAMGPDAGETRTTFDCVKDYDGYTDGPNGITDIAGNAYGSVYQTYVRTVSVEGVSYSPAGWGRTDPITGLLVTVKVSLNGQTLVTLQRVAYY